MRVCVSELRGAGQHPARAAGRGVRGAALTFPRPPGCSLAPTCSPVGRAYLPSSEPVKSYGLSGRHTASLACQHVRRGPQYQSALSLAISCCSAEVLADYWNQLLDHSLAGLLHRQHALVLAAHLVCCAGHRHLNPEYKLRQNIRIAMFYLEDDDAVNAENYIKKASSLIATSKVCGWFERSEAEVWSLNFCAAAPQCCLPIQRSWGSWSCVPQPAGLESPFPAARTPPK